MLMGARIQFHYLLELMVPDFARISHRRCLPPSNSWRGSFNLQFVFRFKPFSEFLHREGKVCSLTFSLWQPPLSSPLSTVSEEVKVLKYDLVPPQKEAELMVMTMLIGVGGCYKIKGYMRSSGKKGHPVKRHSVVF